MSNHKSYSVQVEVPTKKPDLKKLFLDASIHGLREACVHIAERLSSNNDSSRKLGLTIDVPQVQLVSQNQPEPETDEE